MPAQNSRCPTEPSAYPLLSEEVGITAATLEEVAAAVNGAYQQWQIIGAAIEAVRLGDESCNRGGSYHIRCGGRGRRRSVALEGICKDDGVLRITLAQPLSQATPACKVVFRAYLFRLNRVMTSFALSGHSFEGSLRTAKSPPGRRASFCILLKLTASLLSGS